MQHQFELVVLYVRVHVLKQDMNLTPHSPYPACHSHFGYGTAFFRWATFSNISCEAGNVANLIRSGFFDSFKEGGESDILPDSLIKLRNMPHKMVIEVHAISSHLFGHSPVVSALVVVGRSDCRRSSSSISSSSHSSGSGFSGRSSGSRTKGTCSTSVDSSKY